MMAKYLETSLAMLKVVSAPRVISSCLPISTISISLVGLLSRSIMLAASRAGWVPVFMATATSAWARAGASLVPSPVMATSRPPVLVLADQGQLLLGGGLGQEVIHAGFGGDGRGGQRIVAGDHDGLDAHLAQLGKAFLQAAFDDIFQMDHTQGAARCVTPPAGCRRCGRWLRPSCAGRWGTAIPDCWMVSIIVSGAPLRMWVPSKSTPLMRVWAVKGIKLHSLRVLQR